MEEYGSEEEEVTGEGLTASPRSQRVAQVEARVDLELAGSPREEESAAERALAEEGGHGGGDDDGEGSDEDDFAFAVTDGSSFDGLGGVTADEMFSNGLIRPVYPLFDRALVLDGGESSLRGRGGGGGAGGSPSGDKQKPAGRLRELMVEGGDPPTLASSPGSDELGGVPAGSYCAWGPRSAPASPDLRRKSHSAGAGEGSRRWRLLDLVVGRSHSDGKERLVFLQDGAGGAGHSKKKASAEAPPVAAEKKGKGKGRVTEMDMVTAHRLFYARGRAAAAAAAPSGDRRRSFLPYRKDLLGLFNNVNVPSTFQPF